MNLYIINLASNVIMHLLVKDVLGVLHVFGFEAIKRRIYVFG